jgi:hypothetical protein
VNTSLSKITRMWLFRMLRGLYLPGFGSMIYFFSAHYTYVPKVGIVEVIMVALTAGHICRYVELSRIRIPVKHPGLQF